jgi:hypothetical protein
MSRAIGFGSCVPPSEEEEDVPPHGEGRCAAGKSPEEGEECIDICGAAIRNSSPLVSIKKAGSPAQPPAPASSAVVQSTDHETKELAISVLLTRKKEAPEIREPKGPGWERQKARRAVRQMEKAVLPDESIRLQDLAQVGIKQFAYVLEEQFGISLRLDV